MRKNKFMRAASGLLVAVLLTTCVISGTFAKYTTSKDGTDSARVATWGFDEKNASVEFDDLFKNVYANNSKDTVKSNDNKDVIAPGTAKFATFKFDYSGATAKPEVAYEFNVSTDGSTCDETIQNNPNIVWSLDGTEYKTDGDGTSWDKLIAAIKNLSGDKSGTKEYTPGQLPTAFNDGTNKNHTVAWQWKFDENDNDATDTAMGNANKLAEVTLKITITATQVD